MKINGERRIRSVEASAHRLETKIEVRIAQAEAYGGAGSGDPGSLRQGRDRIEQEAREQLGDNPHGWTDLSGR